MAIGVRKNIAKKGAAVSRKRLKYLLKEGLSTLCRKRHLQRTGKKDELVDRLYCDDVQLTDLPEDALCELCYQEDLSDGGTKTQMIERLLRNATSKSRTSGTKTQMINQLRRNATPSTSTFAGTASSFAVTTSVPYKWLLDLQRLDLQDLCRDRDEPVSGNKTELVNRILSHGEVKFAHLSKVHLKQLCDARDLTISGNKEDLISRLRPMLKGGAGQRTNMPLSHARYVPTDCLEDMLKEDLQDLCDKRQLNISGKKKQLVSRILEDGKVKWEELSKPVLQYFCDLEDLPVSGNKDALINRLCGISARDEDLNSRRTTTSASEDKDLLSNDRFKALSKQSVKELCRLLDVKTENREKKELIRELVEKREVTLRSLFKDELRDICVAEDLSPHGTPEELRDRLRNSSSGPQQRFAQKLKKFRRERSWQEEIVSQSSQITSVASMSRAKYAKLLRANGLLEEDQDVFHIISSENGGADHPHNYHYAQNRSWNRAIGANHDYINCFLAGKIKARKAVKVSREIGNYRGKKYDGPGAEDLYEAGENSMRKMRSENRKKWSLLRRQFYVIKEDIKEEEEEEE